MNSGRDILPELDRYVELDVTAPESVAYAKLMQRAEQEATSERLTLSAEGDPGAIGPGLTPAMNEWLNTHVAGIRRSAITALANRAEHVRISDAVGGVFEELVHSRADRWKAEQSRTVNEDFERKHKPLMDDYAEVDAEFKAIRADEGGREPRIPNPWLEFGILLPLVLIPESLLNFESFLRTPIIQTDAMALGVTLIVGIAIAAAAHLVGVYIRQFHYFSRPADHGRSRSGRPMWVLGAVLLLLALASVATARYYYLLPLIQEANVLGMEPPNIVFSIASLLIGNLICFALGAAFTFLLHDRNPDYVDKAVKRRKLSKQLEAARKPVDKRLQEIADRARRDKEDVRGKAQLMAGRPGFAEFRSAVERLRAKDSEVVGLLQAYRSALLQACRENGGRVVLRKRDAMSSRANPYIDLDPDAFLAEPLELHLSEGRS